LPGGESSEGEGRSATSGGAGSRRGRTRRAPVPGSRRGQKGGQKRCQNGGEEANTAEPSADAWRVSDHHGGYQGAPGPRPIHGLRYGCARAAVRARRELLRFIRVGLLTRKRIPVRCTHCRGSHASRPPEPSRCRSDLCPARSFRGGGRRCGYVRCGVGWTRSVVRRRSLVRTGL